MNTGKSFARLAVLAFSASLSLCAVTVRAQGIDHVDLFKTGVWQQTSATTTSEVGYFFAARVFAASADAFDSVTVTSPSLGPTVALRLEQQANDPTIWAIQSGYQSQAGLHASFPYDAYTYTAENSVTAVTETRTLNYQSDAFPGNHPQLDASAYYDLQNCDVTQALHLTFADNAFQTNVGADQSLIFLEIKDADGNVAFAKKALDATTTDILIDPNTLTAGAAYEYDLTYSSRVFDPTGVGNVIGSDTRLIGTFTTAAAVPEPGAASGVIFMAGGTVAFALRRRIARRAAR